MGVICYLFYAFLVNYQTLIATVITTAMDYSD